MMHIYVILFLVFIVLFVLFFFFFSSRRRHTRSTRDWSSDVCSSDLRDARRSRIRDERHRRALREAAEKLRTTRELVVLEVGHGRRVDVEVREQRARSEERRVGKEGRSGGAPDQ